MKKYISHVLLLLVAVLFASCSKDTAADNSEYAGSGNIALRVKARASSSGSTAMTVATPINIYVFDSANKCAAYKQVATESESTEFKLAAGAYSIYAVAGADDESYTLPTADNVSIESVIALNAGKAHGDIMCANGSATLKAGEESEVSLEMSRKVWMLRNVSITDVPDDVEAITATISPLYETVKVNGEYSGENGSETVELTKNTTISGTWESECNRYLMASVGNPSITFTFKTSDGKTKTFKYTSDKALAANYKVNISVAYLKLAEPSLKCQIKGVEWEGEETLSFTVDEALLEESDGQSGSETDTEESSDAPEVGTLYNGCYVLQKEQDGNQTKVVLLSPNQKNSLEYTTTDQSSVKTAIDNVIATLGVDGISGWRLPNATEINLMYENKKAILQLFKDFYTSVMYYYLADDGTIKSFAIANGQDMDLKSGKSTYVLRPVTTIYFTK